MHQRVPRRGVGGLELHGQGSQAALGGSSEGPAMLQQGAVQVQADVGLQALREALQHLERGAGQGTSDQSRGTLQGQLVQSRSLFLRNPPSALTAFMSMPLV